MGTLQLAFWRTVGLAGMIVAIVAFLSENRVADSVNRWTSAVVLIGLPLLFFLLAGIGHGILKRLEEIAVSLKENRSSRT